MHKLFLFIIISVFSSLTFAQTKWGIANRAKYIVNFTNGNLPIYKNEKWGIVDSNNVIRIPIQYDSILPAGENTCILVKKRSYFLYDSDLNLIHKTNTARITYINGTLKLIKGANSKYIDFTSDTTMFFDSEEELNKHKEERDFFKWWSSEYLDFEVLGIKSILKINEGEFLEVEYLNQEKLRTSSHSFFINVVPPHYLSFKDSLDSKSYNLINLKSKKTLE